MAQIFSQSADTLTRLGIAAVVFVPLALISAAIAMTRSSYVTGRNIVITQPVPFSHQHHVAQLGLDCRYCHTGVETSSFAGLPPTETCMTCHSQLWTNASMLAPVRDSLAQNTPIPWQKVHRLPAYVYFDHAIHVAKGVGCTSCHGAVGTMPLMYQAAPLTMDWCLDCHRDPAKQLRPRSEVFSVNWKAPNDQEAQGHALMKAYGIDTRHLTDCSVCHR